jgi:formylglycine-generating enzyme required for sulfatase activity
MPKRSGKQKFLTEAIAKRFLKSPDSVDLSKFTSINDEAAALLVKCGRRLNLNGITFLSGEAARILSARLPRMRVLVKYSKLKYGRFYGELDHEGLIITTLKRYAEFDQLYNNDRYVIEIKSADQEFIGKIEAVIGEDIGGNLIERLFLKFDLYEKIAKQVEAEGEAPRAGLAESSGLITNSVGMNLAPIPSGKFCMGPEGEQQPEVTLTKDFYCGVTQVTQAQYLEIMGGSPSHFSGFARSGRGSSDFPVESVSFMDAVLFCLKLSARPEEKAYGRFYRLPTEAEWEYACRSGTRTAYSFGGSSESLGDYCWFSGNSNQQTHPVGEKKPNHWGLYDMHGNVWEWCWDRFTEDRTGGGCDPTGPTEGRKRVLRGGGYNDGTWGCRSAVRDGSEPGKRHSNVGFRVVLRHLNS